MPKLENRRPEKIHCLTFALAVSVVLSWLGTLGVRAQTDCACPGNRVKLGVIRVKVKAQVKGDQRFWVLSGFPVTTDLQITDPELQPRLKLTLEETAASGMAEQFGFSEATPADIDLIGLLNGKFQANPLFVPAPELIAEPNTADGTFSLCVCGRPGNPPPPTTIKPEQYRVFILLKTASATLAALPVEQVTATADNVSVKLFFTRRDWQHAAADAQARAKPRDRVVAELTAVAQQLLALARQQGLLSDVGKLRLTPEIDFTAVSPFQTAQQTLITDFTRSYELGKPSANSPLTSAVKWRPLEVSIGKCDGCPSEPSEPCHQLCTTPDQPPFVMAVTGLQIVRHIALKVQPDDLDRKFMDKEVGHEFNEQRRTVAQKLNQQFKGKFAAQPGHVITWEQIERDRQLLCPPAQAKCLAVANFLQISSPAPRQSVRNQPANLAANTSDETLADNFNDDSALIYEVERKRKTPGALSISAGGLYSPADSLLGTVGLKEYNLLRLGERASLDFLRGDQVQKIRFQLARPFAAPERAGWRVKDVSVNVNYLRDRQQRLSNLTPTEIEARETGSSAAFTFGYDSFKPDDYLWLNCELFKTRKRTHATLHGETSLGFRALNIPESRTLLALTGLRSDLLPQATTQITPLALNLTATLTHDARQPERVGGLGHVNFSLDTKLQRGMGWFGADYRYYKAAVTGRAEIVFGALSPEDFFVRYVQGLGQSGAGTPVTELFRLGGLSNVRGLEEGEFIGRRVRFAQAEFGINALSLWHLLRKTAAAELNRTPCSPTAGTEAARSPLPFDPANIYLKTFYDFAHLSDSTSFLADPTSFTSRRLAQSVKGYGIALELRNLGNDLTAPLSFTFGYARSPQSVLHRSGTLFTGVSYSF